MEELSVSCHGGMVNLHRTDSMKSLAYINLLRYLFFLYCLQDFPNFFRGELGILYTTIITHFYFMLVVPTATSVSNLMSLPSFH